MSGKTSYAILISFMALYAALAAAHGKEPAAATRAKVLAAVRAGDAEKLRESLDAYDRQLTRAFAPKAKPPKRKVVAKDAPKKGEAKPGRAIGRPIAVVEPIGQPVANPPRDSIAVALDAQLSKLYRDCLKAGPKECCAPMIDRSAKMPDSCTASRSVASVPPSEATAPDASATAPEATAETIAPAAASSAM